MNANTTISERIQALINEFCNGTNSQFAKTIGVNESNIRSYLSGTQPKFDVLSSIASKLAINCEWLLTGKGNMTKQNTAIETPTVSNNPLIGTPYYDIDFLGGFNEVFNSQVNIPATNIVIRGFERADLWCNVTGHSMEPKINHGDIIALRKCTLNDIQYGEIYAVVLDTLRTIKILRKASNPDKLRFIPINIDGYDEQEFDKSRIINIFEVVGSISKFF